MESFIAPGRARKLRKIAETEQHRREVIDEVQAGELTKAEAAEKLAVSVPRVAPILRRREPVKPTNSHRRLDRQDRESPRTPDLQRRAGAIEPLFAQIKHNRKIRTISR